MKLNDVITRQNVISKLLLKDGNKELSKELKVKVMRIRMAYSKLKKEFDSEVEDFTKELATEEFKTLNDKSNRTAEEENRLNELISKMNEDYLEFLQQKGSEDVNVPINDFLTFEEYTDIIDINSGNSVVINGNTIAAADYLEIIYNLFVKED